MHTFCYLNQMSGIKYLNIWLDVTWDFFFSTHTSIPSKKVSSSSFPTTLAFLRMLEGLRSLYETILSKGEFLKEHSMGLLGEKILWTSKFGKCCFSVGDLQRTLVC